MPESLHDELSRVYHKLAAESGYDRNEDERMRIAHALQAVFEARCKAAGKQTGGLWVTLEFDRAVPNPLVGFASSEFEHIPAAVVGDWLASSGTWHFSSTAFASKSLGVVWVAYELQPGRVRGWDFGLHCR
jgi:hypothetical protein